MRYLLLILAVLVIFCAMMAACSPLRRMSRIASVHPAAAAEVCARMFPVKESNVVRIRTVRDTLLRPGEIRYVDCDSAQLHRPGHDTVRLRVKVQCPPQLIVTDTVFRDSVVVQESTAALVAMTAKKDAAEVKAAGLQASRNVWRWAAIILGVLIVIRLMLRYWLKIKI